MRRFFRLHRSLILLISRKGGADLGKNCRRTFCNSSLIILRIIFSRICSCEASDDSIVFIASLSCGSLIILNIRLCWYKRHKRNKAFGLAAWWSWGFYIPIPIPRSCANIQLSNIVPGKDYRVIVGTSCGNRSCSSLCGVYHRN